MSAAEEAAEASEEAAADQADDEEGQPDIEAEEKADLSALAEEVQEATDPVDPDEPDTTESDGDDVAEVSEEEEQGEGTAGDFYVDALVSVSNQIIQEHGREGASEISKEFPRQLRLDEAVDELMAERGESSIPPEQHLLLGTLVFGALVAGTRTDLFDQLIENADFSL